MGAAAIAGFLGAACLVTTCIAALTLVMPLWLAALLMGILLIGISGGALAAGRTRLEQIEPLPQQTIETMKDNVEWVKHHAH